MKFLAFYPQLSLVRDASFNGPSALRGTWSGALCVIIIWIVEGRILILPSMAGPLLCHGRWPAGSKALLSCLTALMALPVSSKNRMA